MNVCVTAKLILKKISQVYVPFHAHVHIVHVYGGPCALSKVLKCLASTVDRPYTNIHNRKSCKSTPQEFPPLSMTVSTTLKH